MQKRLVARWLRLTILQVLSVFFLFNASAKSVEFQFLPPEIDGTFSIGIYDKKGALVRTLTKAAGESAFKIGLNGFIVQWDGKLEDGSPAPKGIYHAKGFVVPGLTISEVATSEVPVPKDVSLAFRSVEAVALRADGSAVAVGTLADGRSALWTEKEILPLQGVGPLNSLVELEGALLVGDAAGVLQVEPQVARVLETGAPTFVHGGAPAVSVVSGQKMAMVATLADFQSLAWEEIPTAFRIYPESGGEFVYCIGEDDSVLKKRKGQTDLEPFEFEKMGKIQAAAAGMGGSLWLVESSEEVGWELHQFAPDGEFLRQMAGSADSAVLALAASMQSDRLVMLRKEKDGAIFLIKLEGEPAADVAESGEEVAEFGEWSFLLIPPPKPVAAESVEVRLTRNPLEPGRVPRIRIRAAVDAEGAYLRTDDGLFLKRLLEEPNARGARIEETKSGILVHVETATGVVRSISVGGIRKTMAFDPGKFSLD